MRVADTRTQAVPTVVSRMIASRTRDGMQDSGEVGQASERVTAQVEP
jgi:hypothetical protein